MYKNLIRIHHYDEDHRLDRELVLFKPDATDFDIEEAHWQGGHIKRGIVEEKCDTKT